MNAKIFDELESVIGKTPLVRLGDRLWAKLETFNLTGSIKDRIIGFIVNEAMQRGEIAPNATWVEASSGNTGIALAAMGAMMGYPVKIIMPRNMSNERKQMMRIYGAEIIEVGDSDFEAAIMIREGLLATNSNYWSPRQFENLDNIKCHYTHMAPEIADQLPAGVNWDAFIAGAGTGGTLMGVHQYVKSNCLDTEVILVVPAEGAKEHGIQGINDGSDFLINKTAFSEVLEVTTEESKHRALRLAKENGLLVGISSGANVVAAERWIARRNFPGAVVTVLCDRGERYLNIFE